MAIRKYHEGDWEQVWRVIEPVFRVGETWPFPPDITEAETRRVWTDLPRETWVATDEDGGIIGSYYIKDNQPGLGSHVCNCGYIVAEASRGRGVASAMCEHSQQAAIASGYRAMQYNLVVSTNEGAVHLWKKMGFRVIGTLPKAFNSRSRGYVDALVMYKELVT